MAATVPHDQQLALELRAQRLEKLDDLRTPDRAVVRSEHEARARKAGDG
ncbi:hypothetical protein HI802_23945 (plasmid) [Ralstonia solanacearum]|nr:hypothetical protein HI802_23945 [Ralstonia solanacearum]QKM00154.1 hypothetical protein HI801_23955 [Ralstonia solanacearum]QLR10642.1 hypothetical protein H1A20_22280 [Ralstonia solanacearum]